MTIRSINTSGLPQGVLTPMGDLLFAASEQGIAKLDFSDFTGMYQDRARTIPYTAVEQTLGSFTGLNGVTATAPADVNRGKVSARVNLLTKTEDFADAAWLMPIGTLATSNSGIAPDGTLTAGKVECTQAATAIYTANSVASGLITGATYRATCHIRSGVGVTSIVFYNGKLGAYKSATINLITGAVTGSNYTTLPVVSVSGDGWVTISVDVIAPDTYGNYCYVQASATAAVGDHFFIWHPSLTLATDAHLPYQRVNTATDYDTAGFSHYLTFNGTNTAYVTPSIDFTGTDKMTVWAGVGTDISGATGYLLNHNGSGGNSFRLGVPAPTGAINSVVIGNNPSFASISKSGLAGNLRSVISASHRSGEHLLRLDSVLVSSDSSATTGPYGGNSYLCIGALTGLGSSFFNGKIYSLIVRGAQSSLSQIEATENLIRKTMRLP